MKPEDALALLETLERLERAYSSALAACIGTPGSFDSGPLANAYHEARTEWHGRLTFPGTGETLLALARRALTLDAFLAREGDNILDRLEVAEHTADLYDEEIEEARNARLELASIITRDGSRIPATTKEGTESR